MANEDVVLTHQGVKELEEKLEYLKTVRRLEIAEEIKTARAFGDLSENAEYDEAKNEQAKIEGEIIMLEKNAQERYSRRSGRRRRTARQCRYDGQGAR